MGHTHEAHHRPGSVGCRERRCGPSRPPPPFLDKVPRKVELHRQMVRPGHVRVNALHERAETAVQPRFVKFLVQAEKTNGFFV